ncbi:MAG: WYL domain-containing protein [Bacteroidota bacterium]|nr:MAG: WYL domain-containing protein [Bacteroidota bacterium]
MPINKNAYLRYKAIDALLATGRGYTKAEILRKIEEDTGIAVSPHTFDKDLQLLRDSLQAPIEYKQQTGYFYTSPDFRLFTQELSDDDIKSLEFASEAMNTLSPELTVEAKAVLMNIYSRAHKATGKPKKQIIFKTVAEPVKGLEWFRELYNAIDEEKALTMQYYKLQTGETKTHTISPYILRQYNDLWYVIAWCASRELTLVFALDRIRDLRPANVTYYQDPNFDAQQYFKYSFGITHSYYDKPQLVKFWVEKNAFYYMQIKPLHPSQKVLEEKPDGYIVQLEVIISEELVMALRGLGQRVKVMAPDKLIKRISEEHG